MVDIKDSEFGSKVLQQKEFAINKKEKGKWLDCDDSKEIIQLQTQQRFIRNYINPDSPYKNLLVMWGTGVGKTLGAVAIAETFRSYMKVLHKNTGNNNIGVYIVSKSEPRRNFLDVLMSGFIKPEYVNDEEREKLKELLEQSGTDEGEKKYLDFRGNLEKRIKKWKYGGMYKFMGYQSFTNKTLGIKVSGDFKGSKERDDRKLTSDRILNMNNSVLIIDEAHSIENLPWGKAVELMIARSTGLRVILLTATPMINLPDEIIQILNIVLPSDDKIKKSEVFTKKGTKGGDESIIDYEITDKGLKILAKKSRGYVSYLRGVNPYTFPRRVDEGVILKKFGFKYTKLVVVGMSKEHTRAYNLLLKSFDISKASYIVISGDRGILDGVFPSEGGKLIYKNDDIYDMLVKSSPEFLRREGIKVVDIKKRGRVSKVIGGEILKIGRIGKWSKKLELLMKNIISSMNVRGGVNFVYTESVRGIGLLMIGEMLKVNGLDEYNFNKSTSWNLENHSPSTRCVMCGKIKKDCRDKKFIPAKFVMLWGEINDFQRLRIIEKVNGEGNIGGRLVKVVLGSSITAESIDFKGIREIHIVNVQLNIPTQEQIIGRAVRHCSHNALRSEDREVKIFKYASGVTGGREISLEENIYLRNEMKHIEIKKIERVLKENAVDCQLNKSENMFQEEVKAGMNGTILCDYTNCMYNCSGIEPVGRDSQINRKRYDLYYYEDEIKDIKRKVKEMFREGIVWKFDTILSTIKKDVNKLYDAKYVNEALNEMIKNKDTLIGVWGDVGRIIEKKVKSGREKVYLFQPLSVNDDDIDLMQRTIKYPDYSDRMINVDNYIDGLVAEKTVKVDNEIANIIKKINKIEDPIDLEVMLTKLRLKTQIKLLERAIIQNQGKVSGWETKVFNVYRDYLLTNNDLTSSGWSSSSSSSSSSEQSDKISGHVLANKPRCLDGNEFTYCIKNVNVKELEKRLESAKVENNIIIGFIDKDSKGKMVFKLREPLKKGVRYIDLRKKPRGYVCSQMNDKKKLISIGTRLGIKRDIENNIKNYCKEIEKKLRENERKEYKKMKWFYNYLEYIS